MKSPISASSAKRRTVWTAALVHPGWEAIADNTGLRGGAVGKRLDAPPDADDPVVEVVGHLFVVVDTRLERANFVRQMVGEGTTCVTARLSAIEIERPDQRDGGTQRPRQCRPGSSVRTTLAERADPVKAWPTNCGSATTFSAALGNDRYRARSPCLPCGHLWPGGRPSIRLGPSRRELKPGGELRSAIDQMQ
jgi:hypothetical protein